MSKYSRLPNFREANESGDEIEQSLRRHIIFDRLRLFLQVIVIMERKSPVENCSQRCFIIGSNPRIKGIEVMPGVSPPDGYTRRLNECAFPLNSQLRRRNGVVTIGLGACYTKPARQRED